MTGCEWDRNAWLRAIAGAAAALLIGAGAAAAEDGGREAASAGFGALRVDLGGAAAAAAADAAGQDTPAAAPAPTPFWKRIEVTGLVDGYYNWNFNEVSPEQLRNFDITHNSFSLNYAEVAIAKPATEDSRAGFRVDFGAGDTAELVNAFEPGGTDYLKHVQQAYLSVLAPVGSGLTIDFGKFVTPAGAEVIESKDNYNYSRGLLFALAIPYYHAGARVAYAVSDKVSLTGYLVNGWNNVKENNDGKTVIGSVTIKPTSTVTVIGNYIVGDEQPEGTPGGGTRNLFDAVVSVAATDKLSVLGNFDYGHDKVEGSGVDWYGVALGAKYQVNDAWAFAPRYEIFKDADGFATGLEQTVQEVTLTAEYKMPAGFLARFEFRNDFSDEAFFLKDNSDLKKTQPTFVVGLMYAFSTKD
jgi:hypothetical protein